MEKEPKSDFEPTLHFPFHPLRVQSPFFYFSRLASFSPPMPQITHHQDHVSPPQGGPSCPYKTLPPAKTFSPEFRASLLSVDSLIRSISIYRLLHNTDSLALAYLVLELFDFLLNDSLFVQLVVHAVAVPVLTVLLVCCEGNQIPTELGHVSEVFEHLARIQGSRFCIHLTVTEIAFLFGYKH